LNEPILIVEKVVKKYGEKIVLKDISFSTEKGSIYSLLGPNGAGKTTLLSIIAGVLEPTSGRVLVKGMDPRESKIRRIIGYCPQEPALYEELTGYENMMFYARIYDINEDFARKRINEMLQLVGLENESKRLVRKYSGGMKKRLSLAIALLPDPGILVLDEPTTGMDPSVRRVIWDLIVKLKKEGKTILLATHYMEEADILSDRVAIMNEGRIIAEGTPEELKTKYGPKSVIEIQLHEKIGEALKILNRFSNTVYSQENIIKIHTNDPDRIVPQIVASLYDHGIKLYSLRVLKPSLEDVFLKLTGRRLTE